MFDQEKDVPPPPAYTPYAQGVQPTSSTMVYLTQPVPCVRQPVQIVEIRFGETPKKMNCPHCQADITTSTDYQVGTFTWVACAILAFLGLWLFCCLIPFCVNGCKDVVHTCPNCKSVVGRFNRM